MKPTHTAPIKPLSTRGKDFLAGILSETECAATGASLVLGIANGQTWESMDRCRGIARERLRGARAMMCGAGASLPHNIRELAWAAYGLGDTGKRVCAARDRNQAAAGAVERLGVGFSFLLGVGRNRGPDGTEQQSRPRSWTKVNSLSRRQKR